MPDRKPYHASAECLEEALLERDEAAGFYQDSTLWGSHSPPHIGILGSSARNYRCTGPSSSAVYIRICFWKWCLCFSSLLLTIFAAAAMITWFGIFQPDLPEFNVEKIKIDGFHVHARRSEMVIPKVLLDINLTLSVQVVNPNSEGFMYDETVIHVAYEGQRVGKVTSPPGSVPPRSSRLVVGIADLQGVDVGRLGPKLVDDWRKGLLSAVIATVIRGRVSVLTLQTFVEASVYCDLLVNPRNRTLLAEECDVAVKVL
eukprot:TRINITY_DN14778_c1_g3_i1.p1 TRINITY_DN14778_c1_g3~~TRINITY_DN14778_c1_g3_i1.p1  ORF type:complete len:258 (+),score=32.59 TRINITY_DN14778_c1_g3_i1:535-1308(+)